VPLTLIMCVNVSVLHPPCSGGDADGRWEKNSGEAVVALELREAGVLHVAMFVSNPEEDSLPARMWLTPADVLLGGARTRMTRVLDSVFFVKVALHLGLLSGCHSFDLCLGKVFCRCFSALSPESAQDLVWAIWNVDPWARCVSPNHSPGGGGIRCGCDGFPCD